MLFVVLHLVFYLVMGLSLCGYMYLLIWHCCEEANGHITLAFVMPTLGNVVTLLFAWAIGLTAPQETKLVVLACDFISFLLLGVFVWILSIKRYRDDENDPEYISFWVVVAYLALVLLGSAIFILLF